MRNTKLLTILLLLAAGCNTLRLGPSVKKPNVEVTAITMEAFSKRGVGGQMELNIANPNKVALALRYIEWEMSVGGDRAVSGYIDVKEQLPAQGAAPVSVALEVLADDAFRVVPHLEDGNPDYQLRGVLHYMTPEGDMSVGFTSSGVL